MDPQGGVVIVTGASSGIGEATARVFASAGADVALVARSGDTLDRLAATLPGHPLVVPTDMSIPSEARKMVERVISERGRVDILINNAGVGVVDLIESLSLVDLEYVFSVNILGPLAAIQAVLPSMRTRKSGQIINVSSVLGVRALPYSGGYCASKAALDRLTESLRVELLGSGVAVTLVRPGTTRTAFFEKRLGQGHEVYRKSLRGVSGDVVAHTLLRAARYEPRIAYVTRMDRLQLFISLLFPTVVDQLLGWAFRISKKNEHTW